MNLSNTQRGSLSLAVVVGIGVTSVALLLLFAPGLSTRMGKLWDWTNHTSETRPPTAALIKGIPGYDFTRIGRSGKVLVRQDAIWQNSGRETEGTQWDCLRDNVTGLWWEAKTHEDAAGAKHLRHVDHTYSGSSAHAYVDAVNTAGLCGFSDWRLPTVLELKPLASINKGGATIDLAQFPNTAAAGYWTASAYPYRESYVWYVYFAGAGDSFGDTTSANYAVRLVRNGQ